MMKRIVLAAMLSAAVAQGQHVSVGGSGGRSGGGGFSAPHFQAPAGRGFASPGFAAPRFSGSGGSSSRFGSVPTARSGFSRPQYSSPTGNAPFGGGFPIGERAGGGEHRRRYERNRGYGYGYGSAVYAVPGWLNYGYGYGDAGYGYADQPGVEAPPVAAPEDTGYAGEPDGPPQARPEYEPQRERENVPSAEPADQPEVTLVFKDGRPQEQVKNYAVTQTTVYVLDGARRREIPLSALDIARTEQVNRAAGLDFDVPVRAN